VSWTTPKTWNVGDPATSADLNTYVRDNASFLYGDAGWTNASGFTNSWAANPSPNIPRFMVMGRVVYLTGMVSGGTLGSAAFTLPAGYRPSQTVQIGTVSNGAFGQVFITSAGLVTPSVGSVSNVSLHCTFSLV
jgi:hypothetical protein